MPRRLVCAVRAARMDVVADKNVLRALFCPSRNTCCICSNPLPHSLATAPHNMDSCIAVFDHTKIDEIKFYKKEKYIINLQVLGSCSNVEYVSLSWRHSNAANDLSPYIYC